MYLVQRSLFICAKLNYKIYLFSWMPIRWRDFSDTIWLGLHYLWQTYGTWVYKIFMTWFGRFVAATTIPGKTDHRLIGRAGCYLGHSWHTDRQSQGQTDTIITTMQWHNQTVQSNTQLRVLWSVWGSLQVYLYWLFYWYWSPVFLPWCNFIELNVMLSFCIGIFRLDSVYFALI